MDSYSCEKFSRNGLRRCPFTLKMLPFLGFSVFMAPWGKTFLTMKGPVHLDLNFLENKCNIELYKRTFWDGSKDFLKICLSWKTFILSLEILEFSYASRRISSNSFDCNFHNFLNELALSKLKLNIFIANTIYIPIPHTSDKFYHKQVYRETYQEYFYRQCGTPKVHHSTSKTNLYDLG